MNRVTTRQATLTAALTGITVAVCASFLGLRGQPRQAEAAQPPASLESPTPLPSPAQPSEATPSPAPEMPQMPAGLKPDELGRIPILMYHSVGEGGPYDRHGLNISPETFRKHLHLLHDSGFYPVNMRDLMEPRLAVPPGLSPVVLTFDDARGSQFHYKKDGTIDPNCAVGILDAFHKKYGADWRQRATFFVLPASKYNPVPFWQPGKETQKLRYLVATGYEVANHSTSHRPLSRLNATELAWEVKFCRDYVQHRAPGATMDTMAVPYGIFPRTPALCEVLMDNGNHCLLMAWGDASYAPTDKRFQRRRIMRIGTEPGTVERWVKALVRDRKNNGALRPYVSDGDPDTLSVPQSLVKYVDKERLGQMRLIALSDTPPAKASKQIAAAPVHGHP